MNNIVLEKRKEGYFLIGFGVIFKIENKVDGFNFLIEVSDNNIISKNKTLELINKITELQDLPITKKSQKDQLQDEASAINFMFLYRSELEKWCDYENNIKREVYGYVDIHVSNIRSVPRFVEPKPSNN